MPSYDFSAPFAAARIILPNGDAFPLWTNIGGAETTRPEIPGQPDLRALCFVQEIQVKLNLAGLPDISVQMAPTFEDGMKFLDSALADPRMQNQVEVQLGYAGGTGDAGPQLSPIYSASLQAPEVTVDAEVQIALKGRGLGNSAAFQGGRAVGGANESRRQLIERLVSGAKGERRKLRVDWSVVNELGAGNRTYDALEASASGWAQGNRTDWLAIWHLAQDTYAVPNFIGSFSDGASKLVWLPREERFRGPPVRRYRLFHYPGGQFRGHVQTASTDEEVGELPLMSFSCNTQAIWGAMTYAEINGQGIELNEVDADEVIHKGRTVSMETEAPPVDGNEGAQTIPGNEEIPGQPNQVPGDPADPGAVRQAAAEVETTGGMSAHCEIETVGDPVVMPGDVILLAGLGSRFDRRVYHVQEVTHSIGLGGFATNLLVHSNLDPNSEGEDPAGERNTADVQPSVHSRIAMRARAELAGGD